MAQNFLVCGREQPFLLPPDVSEWLPDDHLTWVVFDAVGVMDTSLFCTATREDGHGRAAHEPSMTHQRGRHTRLGCVIGVLGYCKHAEAQASVLRFEQRSLAFGVGGWPRSTDRRAAGAR